MDRALDTLLIENYKFAWRDKLSAFEENLSWVVPDDYHGGWHSMQFSCKEVLGIPAISGNARSPALDRPVMQVIFELPDPGLPSIDKCIAYWIETLSNKLGKPLSVPDHVPNRNDGPYGNVIYYVKWLTGDTRVTLSVYGSGRSTKEGMSIAGLFIDWKNEIKAAEPYQNDFVKSLKVFNAAVDNLDNIKVINLGIKQIPYYMADYENQPHDKALKDNALRIAQKCLYSRDLLETPESIKSRLNENSVAIWQSKNSQFWGVSTYSDSVIFGNQEDAKIEFFNMLPAKGPGGMDLNLGDLKLSDKANSTKLKQLVKELENVTGKKVVCHQGYDY